MPLLTPDRRWLGVFIFTLAVAGRAFADCVPPPELPSVRIAEIVDGDTLRLADGRLVRLLGINTPELGRDGRPDQPLAVPARRALRDWFAGSEVLLQAGSERRDRHGRLLASVFRAHDRRHAGEFLLRRGLGWQVAVPPNLTYVDCLRAAERRARHARRGVWAPGLYPVRPVATLAPGEGGFLRLKGRVTRVAESRHACWIELGEHLSLRVARADAIHFPGVDWHALEGQELTLRGWLIYRGKQKRGHPPHLMHLRHPVMLESIKE